MTIIKHYCDYCGSEMMFGQSGSYSLKAHLEFDHVGRDMAAGYKHRDFSGSFCGIQCAGNFIAADGQAAPTKRLKALVEFEK